MTVKMNTKGLDDLLKAMKKQGVTAQVGIIGPDATAMHYDDDGNSSGMTNAEIGAVHEYGLGGFPVRSFLRVPLSKNLPKALTRAGLFKKDVLKESLAAGSFVPIAEKMGIVGVAVVMEAFANGGADGEWPPSDMTRKKVKQTLVETTQLRDSITSKVVTRG